MGTKNFTEKYYKDEPAVAGLKTNLILKVELAQ